MRPIRPVTGRSPGRRTSYAAAALAVVLAGSAVAGCGGSATTPQQTGGGSTSASSTAPGVTPSSSPAGAAAAWAAGFCGALAGWETSVRTQVTRPPATPTVAGQSPSERLRGEVRARLNGVAEATDQLLTDLHDVGPPRTGAAQEAAKELSALEARLRTSVDTLRAMVTKPVGDVSSLKAQAAQIKDIVRSALADVQQTVGRIQALDPSGELSGALASDPACRSLRHEMSSGTPST